MTSEHESPPEAAETAVEVAESPSEITEVSRPDDARPNRVTSWCLEQWRSILVAALVVAAVALAVCVLVFLYRPDRQIDDAAAQRALRAASDGAVASVSYSPANMAKDFAAAKSHLTGEFLDYYDRFTKELVTPMVQEKQISQTAAVVRAAVSELHPDSAVVLVFLNETTVSKDKQQPLTTPSSVRITLTKVNGSWLISKLVPFG